MARQMVFELVGDSERAEKAFRNVGSASDRMADEVKANASRMSNALESVEGSVDTSEGRFMGMADLLDGLGSAFGLPVDGAVNMARAFGDMAGGVTGFVVPAVQRLGAMLGLSTGATQAAAGANVTFGASLTAALGPIALVVAAIAAIVAIGYVVVRNWDTIKEAAAKVWEWIQGGWDRLLGFFGSIPGRIGELGGTLFDVLTWPYRTAFNAIAELWNHTVGALSFEVPDWVPMIGGKGWDVPDMPKFHSGGVVPGLPGTEVPILALAGERVTPVGRPAAPASNITIYAQTNASARDIADELTWQAKVSGF